MQKSFKISHSIEAEGEGFCYDLHNNYEFLTLQINSKNQQVVIRFAKTRGHRVPVENPPNLELSFYGLIHISFSEGFFINQSKTIEEIGYKESNNDNLDWLIEEDKTQPEYHLIIRFDNDEFIRIYAETAEIKVNSQLL